MMIANKPEINIIFLFQILKMESMKDIKIIYIIILYYWKRWNNESVLWEKSKNRR